MVDFKKLSAQAKDLVEKRGGTEGLKRDASELAEIAKRKGTLSDKAKAAAAALKESKNEPPAPAGDAMPVADKAPRPDPEAPGVGERRDTETAERKAEHRKERAERKAERDDPAQ